jgi:hypothetical protein
MDARPPIHFNASSPPAPETYTSAIIANNTDDARCKYNNFMPDLS